MGCATQQSPACEHRSSPSDSAQGGPSKAEDMTNNRFAALEASSSASGSTSATSGGLVAYDTAEGKRLASRMRAQGYDALARWCKAWEPQSAGNFCAPASAVCALKFLRLLGQWTQLRIYYEVLLPNNLLTRGVSFEHGAEMMRKVGGNRIKVETRISRNEDDLDCWLREDLAEAFQDGAEMCLLANYWRTTGGGHWSPLGGWAEDQVLIMDTNHQRFPPHWVSIRELVRSLCRHNEITGLPRGYLVVRPSGH